MLEAIFIIISFEFCTTKQPVLGSRLSDEPVVNIMPVSVLTKISTSILYHSLYFFD